MRQNYRDPQSGRSTEQWRGERGDYGRGGRYRSGEGERYRSGGERRYMPEWEERERGASRGFEGGRSYDVGGYPEEFGYRRDYNAGEDYRNEFRSGRGGYRPSGFGGESERRRGPANFGREEASDPNWQSPPGYGGAQRSRGYEESMPLNWHDSSDTGEYFGTGSYGGSYSTGPSVRASASGGAYGPRGPFAGEPRGGSESDDWQSERQWRTPFEAGYGGSSNYGPYGSQSSYARNAQQPGYGQDENRQDERRWGASAQSLQSISHRGHGPKGYQRSDERLKEIICERLTDDPLIDASNVTVEVIGQIVTITGTVDERRTKYEIEDLIERTANVKDIDNQLRVQASTSALGRGSQEAGSQPSASSSQSAPGSQSAGGGRSAESSRSGTSATGTSATGAAGTAPSGTSTKHN